MLRIFNTVSDVLFIPYTHSVDATGNNDDELNEWELTFGKMTRPGFTVYLTNQIGSRFSKDEHFKMTPF